MNAQSPKTNRLEKGACIYFFHPSFSAVENSKLQAPSPRETSDFNHQLLKLGAGCFIGCWLLAVGCFHFHA
jgi:hypothetical protein